MVQDLLIKFLVMGLINKTCTCPLRWCCLCKGEDRAFLLLWGRCNSCKIVLWLQVKLQWVQMSLKVMCCYYYDIPGGRFTKFPVSPWGLFSFKQELVGFCYIQFEDVNERSRTNHKWRVYIDDIAKTGGWGSSAQGQSHINIHTSHMTVKGWQQKLKNIYKG